MLLLFVIRDYSEVTPLQIMEDILKTDLESIWYSIRKPPELKDRQLSDYFDLAFTSLPHKIFFLDKFESSVRELQTRFQVVDETRPDYFLKPLNHDKTIADGVAPYMKLIWVSFT
jgi:protein SEY1